MSSNCDDLMIYDGQNKLNHWISDNSCNTDSTYVWFLVPSIASNEAKTITIYYGNVHTPSTGNGYSTFPVYFDDFERTNNVWYNPTFGKYTSYNVKNPNAGRNMFVGLNISNGKLNQSSSATNIQYAHVVQLPIIKPNNTNYSLFQKIKFSSLASSAFRSNILTFYTDTNYGFDMRSPGYDLKYYLGSNSTWLHGQGAYYKNIDYITEYRFTNTLVLPAGTSSGSAMKDVTIQLLLTLLPLSYMEI